MSLSRRWLPAAAACVLAWAHLSCGGPPEDTRVLSGRAETLWGETEDLTRLRGLVLIEPFSPANCGYCLFDGEFIRRNYFDPNAASGGRSFHLCLFNPQRDVYAYLKHYRESAVPVLTAPAALHRYHRDGFPFMIAFRDGEPLYASWIHPYEETCRKLHDLFWPGRGLRVVPTSPFHMAGRFIGENESRLAVHVVADGDTATMRQTRQRLQRAERPSGEGRFESDLTAADLARNLYFSGPIDRYTYESLAVPGVPIGVTRQTVAIGPYRFDAPEITLRAAFPNPHNPERYVALSLASTGGQAAPANNWADYSVHRVTPTEGSPELLLQGLFAKPAGGPWAYGDSLAFPSADLDQYCLQGRCPAPSALGAAPRAAPVRDAGWERETTPVGTLYTLGGEACRLPSVAVTPDGRCWVAWEQGGRIAMAVIGADGPEGGPVTLSDDSDCYDPVLGAGGQAVWACYLSSRDGFYRVCGGRVQDGRIAAEIVLSECGPCDAVTPAIAADDSGRVVVAWSEWRANQRFLQYRTLVSGVLGPVAEAAIAPSQIDYTNAWYPSLAFDRSGKPWGAWNQHYPSTLGVCAGNLRDEAASVTPLGADLNSHVNGGYPFAVVDGAGRRWVFWESFGWDVLSGQPQQILAARFDETVGGWTLPEVVAHDASGFLRQTPCAATDRSGSLRAFWSGRGDSDEEPWAVYASRRMNDEWTAPVRLSAPGINARAPRVARGADGSLWVCWHAGRGAEMRVQVLALAQTES